VTGYEISEVLEVKPAEYFVELTKREKPACIAELTPAAWAARHPHLSTVGLL
jgi:hypothetical protein